MKDIERQKSMLPALLKFDSPLNLGTSVREGDEMPRADQQQSLHLNDR